MVTAQRFNFWLQNFIAEPQEFFLPFLCQAQNGLADLATEKSGKMDVAEALDLSEKLVCADSLPSKLGSPAVSVSLGVA